MAKNRSAPRRLVSVLSPRPAGVAVVGVGLLAGAGLAAVGAGWLAPAPRAMAEAPQAPAGAPVQPAQPPGSAAAPAAAALPAAAPFQVRLGAPAADLQQEVAAIVARRCPKGVEIAVSVVEVGEARELAEVGGAQPMTPASNMKLLTSVAAIEVLGPEFQFRTRLLLRPAAAGAADPRPTLVVAGDGDPGFLDPVLLAQHGTTPEQVVQAWVAAVRAAAPQGCAELVVDARVFDADARPDGWPKDQLHTWYGAPVSGLNFADNVVSVQSQPTAPGGGVNIQVFPMLADLQVVNTARTVRAGEKQGLQIGLQGDRLLVGGSAAYASVEPFRMAFANPDGEFGDWFARKLGAAGVAVGRVRGAGAGDPAADGRLLAEWRTPLADALLRTNRDSYNLYAECLLKRLAHARTGQPGSFADGNAAVGEVLGARLGAPALAGWRQVDGCGLSRDNRVSARLLASALTLAARDGRLWPALAASLARPGQPGTLEARFKDRPTRAQVLAKTGYINGASTLSGVLVAPARPGRAPQALAFSILCNGALSHAAMKPIQEEIVHAVDGWMAK